jgi:Tfp pilus assembly protein PilZ
VHLNANYPYQPALVKALGGLPPATILLGIVHAFMREGDMVSFNMPFGERRMHERKSCTRMVGIIDSKTAYTAHLRDLAPGGALIEPPLDVSSQIGEKLKMTIPYGLKKRELTIRAEIAWIRPHGMGVRFLNNTVNA